MDIALLLIVLLAAILAGIPIAYSLVLAALAFAVFFDHGVGLGMLVHSFTIANDSFPILAVPFFILAGMIMGKGGISRRLFNVATAWVGHVRGGFGVAAVLTALFFSAISGSGPGTVAAVGGMMIPQMVKRGYSRTFSGALIAAAGTMGVIIPPSIPLVIYGVTTGTSIGDLFLAGIIPGLLMSGALIVWAVTHARRRGIQGTEKAPLSARLRSLNQAKGALFLPVLILGGIYGGVFTPTEAAVVAVVYAGVFSTLIYRELDLSGLFRAMVSAATICSAIMLIVAAAAPFALFLAVAEAPGQVLNLVGAISTDPVVVICIVMVFLLLLGTFMETIAAITITAPILIILLGETDMDPVQIGILLVMFLALGFVSPPLGPNIFVAAKTAGVANEKLFVAVLPGFALLIGVCVLVAFVPALSLGLLSR
ncbi:TRAP transporter large permease [Pseudonocardia nematodicida]|uniref:TRAP transporter large permease n=1 Tax=Pseudonocardia nematodicida TaxID=1206997 RepID=A0ABV1KJ41_9PSEU